MAKKDILDKAKRIGKVNVQGVLESSVREKQGRRGIMGLIEDLRVEIRNIKLKAGKDGERGPRGIQGPPGPRGKQGPKGDKPIAGIDFAFPKDGKDGKHGKDGRTPIKGVDYKDGDPGKDGSPDTPKEIADKLNTLKGKVDIKVIEGLQQQLTHIDKNMQILRSRVSTSGSGGGGGMSTPLHQTFNGDDSATSFTLSSRVAADGNAAWVYYNGQFLVKDTHWTVSDTTLSLTFTPESGTQVDVTYFRT